AGGLVYRWDLSTGKRRILALRGETGAYFYPLNAAVSANGRFLACLMRPPVQSGKPVPPPQILVAEIDTGKARATLAMPGDFGHIAISPDGKLVACYIQAAKGAIKVWDWATGKELLAAQPHAETVHFRSDVHLSFSADSTTLATSFGADTVMLWE